MFNFLIAICWLVFIIFWIASSSGVKNNIQENKRQLSSSFRLIITTVTVSLLFNITPLRQLRNYHVFPLTSVVQATGVFICASGIAFSIWAKTHLGRNWGMPMAMKEKPDLVVTGPYSFIRHPIYTGVSIAMFGSTVTAGFTWLVWFVLFFCYFIYSAKKEEKLMLLQFPKEYHHYMKRTKMFIPFIF
jgi:protein-S-isoprenylcysteine O-methyltransferase Ste14